MKNIELDSVADLGDFLEVEYHGDINDLSNGKKIITDFIKEIYSPDFEILNIGYLDMIHKKSN